MSEKIKEIENIKQLIKMGVIWFPIEQVNDLLSKIKELEERIQLAEATRDDALAYAKMFKTRVK